MKKHSVLEFNPIDNHQNFDKDPLVIELVSPKIFWMYQFHLSKTYEVFAGKTH